MNFSGYVEGDKQSWDTKIYQKLFPDLLVEGKDNKDSVIKTARVLRESEHIHHIEVFGLIDRDCQDENEINSHVKKNIWVLEVYAVEALFFAPESIKAVASHGGVSAKIATAMSGALNGLKQDPIAERMASYRASYLTDKEIDTHKPGRKNINGIGDEINPKIPILYKDELNCFRTHVKNNDWNALIRDYPIHKTPALNQIATTLGMTTDCYKKTLVSLLGDDKNLADKLRQYIAMEEWGILL